MSNTEKKAAILGGIFVDSYTQQFTERTFRIFNDSDGLSALADKWRNVSPDIAQGHSFEQLETIKFNIDALKKDSILFAKTTASMGLATDPVDIIITDGKKIIREIQAKSCNSAARTTFSLSQDKYQEMLRLGPSDQHAMVEKLLKKRIEVGTLKAEDYQQTLRNLKKSLQHDGVGSRGTTYQEALDATNREAADKLAASFKLTSALADMHESGKRAGNVGAAINASVSFVSESVHAYKGEQEIGRATLNIALAGAKGYATGYAVTAISKGITHSVSHVASEQMGRALARSNAHVAIAAGVVNASKACASYLKGDINSEQLADELTHVAITGTASFYYGALGQIAIPIPVVGALVGAAVGYYIGSLIHQSGLVALGDSAEVKIAKERRKQIEAMCLAAIPEIRKNRIELEGLLEKYFEDRKDSFISSFEQMDIALQEWEPDKYMSGLNVLNSQFGLILPFKNFEEFDQMMLSGEAFEF